MHARFKSHPFVNVKIMHKAHLSQRLLGDIFRSNKKDANLGHITFFLEKQANFVASSFVLEQKEHLHKKQTIIATHQRMKTTRSISKANFLWVHTPPSVCVLPFIRPNIFCLCIFFISSLFSTTVNVVLCMTKPCWTKPKLSLQIPLQVIGTILQSQPLPQNFEL